jgi:hypothetical protein
MRSLFIAAFLICLHASSSVALEPVKPAAAFGAAVGYGVVGNPNSSNPPPSATTGTTWAAVGARWSKFFLGPELRYRYSVQVVDGAATSQVLAQGYLSGATIGFESGQLILEGGYDFVGTYGSNGYHATMGYLLGKRPALSLDFIISSFSLIPSEFAAGIALRI